MWREKSFLNIDIKSLIEKCLELLFKTFRTSFTGDFVSPRAYKFIKYFIYCHNFMFASATQSERVLINVFRWLKFHFKTFSNPFFNSLTPRLLQRAIINIYKEQWKHTAKQNEKLAASTKWKLKLVRKNKYMIIVFAAFGEWMYTHIGKEKEQKQWFYSFTIGWHNKHERSNSNVATAIIVFGSLHDFKKSISLAIQIF